MHNRPEIVERLVDVNGVELCTESFGDPSSPPVLLVMGLGASMLWWDEGFCRLLAGSGRFVIRYDHRDTGRSTTCEPGRPGYTAAELRTDALAVLDGYALPAAHLVGVSAGGAIAQLLALDFPDRVLSLALISTSPATAGDRDLPPPSSELMRFWRTAAVDWSDPESVIDYLVAYMRVLAGDQRRFEDDAARALVRAEVERAYDFAARRNHDRVTDGDREREPLSSIAAPTLVIHGTADPMFPLAHGKALAAEIRGAQLLQLEGAGHGLYRADWGTVVRAIADGIES